jgi:hypothetical protein
MVERTTALLLGAALLLGGAQARRPAQAKTPQPPLRLERTIPLGNAEGRLGHPVIDSQRQRLFVPAPAAGSVQVVDLNAGKMVKSIQGLQRPQSVAWHPEKARLYVTTRQDAAVSIYDAQLNLIRKVPLTAIPDEVRVVPGGKQVLVGAGNTIVILDLEGQTVGTIRLDGPPSAFLVASGGQRLWLNLPVNKTLVSADLVSRVALRSFAVNTEMLTTDSDSRANYTVSSGTNSAFAFDERGRRLIVATRRPSKFVVLDSDSGTLREARLTVADPEDIWFDPSTHRIFITGTDPQIDVISQTDQDHYEPITRIPSAPGARTSLLVPEQGRFYVAAPAEGAKPAVVLVYSVSK